MSIRSTLRQVSAIRRLRRFMLRAIGADPRLRTDAHISTELLGSSYGGWYVAVSRLPASPRVLSLGIGTDLTFDHIMIDRFGASVVGCDPTPVAAETVAKAGLPADRYAFLPVAASDFDGRGTFEPVIEDTRPSGCHRLTRERAGSDAAMAVDVRDIGSLVREHLCEGIDVLKRDIEGAKYEVIPALLSSGMRPAQILVEFHHRFAGRGVTATLNAVEALRAAGYALIRLSDQGPEYTFIHTSALKGA